MMFRWLLLIGLVRIHIHVFQKLSLLQKDFDKTHFRDLLGSESFNLKAAVAYPRN